MTNLKTNEVEIQTRLDAIVDQIVYLSNEWFDYETSETLSTIEDLQMKLKKLETIILMKEFTE